MSGNTATRRPASGADPCHTLPARSQSEAATEISRRTDYAVRILLELARRPAGGRVPARELGTSLGVPLPFARRIVTQLASAGLIDARRGSLGGVGLARPAGTITLSDVIDVMEGGVALNLCARDPAACPYSPGCPAHAVWQNAGRVLTEHLGGYSIADLAGPLAGPAGAEAPKKRQRPAAQNDLSVQQKGG